MNRNKNNSSEDKIKDPYFKIRYAAGLGDFIKCILHSKMLNWLTKLITGKDKPCSKCAKRANALNILFPIKFWKLFFKTQEEYINSFKEELQKAGYSVSGSAEEKYLSASKVLNPPTSNPSLNPILPTNTSLNALKEDQNYSDFKLLASSDNYVGDFLIKTQIFKVK